jgi:1-acyl-sn-glycerol-3-phosphate acyltransferase
MRPVRVALRLVGFAAVSLVLVPVLLLGWPVAALFGRALRWRVSVAHLWARACVRALGVRIQSRGEAPRGPFLLVSNHLSYMDVLVLLSMLRASFVSKAEVAGWPAVGFLARIGGTLFLDRTRKKEVVRIAEEIRSTLERGVGVVLFPEGTSTQGAGVLAFRSSLLEPAAALGLPVRYASLRYTTEEGEEPAWNSVSWWGDAPFLPHLRRLLGLSRIEARLDFGPEPITDPDRKSLAQRLHRAVASRFEPMAPSDDACLKNHPSPASS